MATITIGVNSYVDLAFAADYFDGRYGYTLWTPASDPDKTAALISACAQMNVMCEWLGTPTDPSQVLPFPRYPDTEAPDDIKFAQCEIAYSMIAAGTSDPATVDVEAPLSKLKAGDVELEFDTGTMSSKAANLTNEYTRALLSQYGMCGNFGGDLKTRQVDVWRA